MILLYLIMGIFLTSTSLFMIILYSNLLYLGYSLIDYFIFIIKKPCFIFLLLGIYIIIKSIICGGKSEVLLKRKFKFFR